MEEYSTQDIINVSKISSPPAEAILKENDLFCASCNNATSGAHKCVECEKSVHAINICSLPLNAEDEAYSHKRIFSKCSKSKDGAQIVATNEIENWKGKVVTKEKLKAKYILNTTKLSQNLEIKFL